MKSILTSFSALFVALSASTCCLGPLLSLAGLLGLSASYLNWLSSVKNYLIITSLILVGFSLYRAYFPKKSTKNCCDITVDKKQTKMDAIFKSKKFLWSVVVLTLTTLLLPYLTR